MSLIIPLNSLKSFKTCRSIFDVHHHHHLRESSFVNPSCRSLGLLPARRLNAVPAQTPLQSRRWILPQQSKLRVSGRDAAPAGIHESFEQLSSPLDLMRGSQAENEPQFRLSLLLCTVGLTLFIRATTRPVATEISPRGNERQRLLSAADSNGSSTLLGTAVRHLGHPY